MGGSVAIAIHDVAPQTAAFCADLVRLVRSIGGDLPLTLLVIPQMHGASPIEKDRACREFIDRAVARGAEVALHGFYHLDTGLGTRRLETRLNTRMNSGGRSPSISVALARRFLSDGEAEFAAIDAAAARLRIELGLASLERCGWPVRGFVPPAWQITDAAVDVLREFPFDYVTTLGSLISLPEKRSHPVPCLGFSARSRARRAVSRRWVAWRLSRTPHLARVRVALHPADASHPELLTAWARTLSTLLQHRQPVTKSAMCRSLTNVSP